jgi:hypothetical protein
MTVATMGTTIYQQFCFDGHSHRHVPGGKDLHNIFFPPVVIRCIVGGEQDRQCT